MEKQNLLIILMKNPTKGMVKTRLARGIGDEKALMVYRRLINHTFSVSMPVAADKAVFYSDFIDEDDSWKKAGCTQYVQEGHLLGEKILNSFKVAFSGSYKKAIIIGSDNFEITPDILEQAFESLDHYDAVIGPALDGGYYLLGKKWLIPELFSNKEWSTDTVFDATIKDFQNLGLSYKVLKVLSDIDEIEDLPAELI